MWIWYFPFPLKLDSEPFTLLEQNSFFVQIIFSYGVISAPEVTDWQSLTENDTYLVAASDGVFEKLSLQDICDILWELHTDGVVGSGLSPSCLYSLADCLVNSAFEKGTMDNMAAVVVPLGSTYVSQNQLRETCVEEGHMDCSTKGLQKSIHRQSGKSLCSQIF